MFNLKKVIASVAALAMSLSCFTAFAADFSDVEASSKYKAAIDELVALEIVNGYEDGKIHWDRMSKEELQNFALKMADTLTLTSTNITETDIIYNFEGDGYRAILHRTNFVSSLKPYQTTLQIVE